MDNIKKDSDELQAKVTGKSPQEILSVIFEHFGQDVKLASSLGAEDQVLTDMCLKLNPKTKIIVLDTGRLHQETYDVMADVEKKYGIRYEVYFPKADAVEAMVREKGPNLFYESIDNRKQCCHIRKVEPLQRALKDAKVWITGLRRAQAVTRAEIPEIEFDETHQMIKVNPLASWSVDDVWDYIKENEVPYNVLHDQGFASIGCAPCTRAIKPGEDIRAGRWWWETPEQKECGLHIKDGKLVRKNNNDT